MSSDSSNDNPHIVARLEAFSDIVIGFSLAQAAINLVVTGSVESFFAHPLGIAAYLATFALVARMWWVHSKIMHRFFEPNRIMIALNFAALASLGLMIFALQLWMHRGNDVDGQMLALRFYFLCFGATVGLMAVMRALGVRYRWEHLQVAERRHAMRLSMLALISCVAMVAGALLPSGHDFFGLSVRPMPANLLYALVLSAVISRFARSAFEQSRWGETEAAASHA